MHPCPWPGCAVACFRNVACPRHLKALGVEQLRAVRLYYDESDAGRLAPGRRDELVRRVFREAKRRAEGV